MRSTHEHNSASCQLERKRWKQSKSFSSSKYAFNLVCNACCVAATPTTAAVTPHYFHLLLINTLKPHFLSFTSSSPASFATAISTSLIIISRFVRLTAILLSACMCALPPPTATYILQMLKPLQHEIVFASTQLLVAAATHFGYFSPIWLHQLYLLVCECVCVCAHV